MRGLSGAGGTNCPECPTFQENHQHMTTCSFGGGGCISVVLAVCAHVCQSLNSLQTSSNCLLSAVATGPLFQPRRLHNNAAQSEGYDTTFIMLSDSVGQELRRGTAWKACLCARMSGPLLEKSKAGPGAVWGLIHFQVWWLMLAVSWGLGSFLCAPTVWATGVLVTGQMSPKERKGGPSGNRSLL